MLYLVGMTSFTLVEGVIGISLKNVHVLKDFFGFFMMLVTLGFSSKAIDVWNET